MKEYNAKELINQLIDEWIDYKNQQIESDNAYEMEYWRGRLEEVEYLKEKIERELAEDEIRKTAIGRLPKITK